MVHLSGIEKGQLLQVFDIPGHRLISRELLGNNETVGLKDFAPGTYQLIIGNGAERQSIRILRID